MNDLEILVPLIPGANLELCLAGIGDNTPIRSYSVIGLARGLVAEVPAEFPRSAVPWTIVQYEERTETEMVLEAIHDTQAVYVIVVPATHAIADKGWFGKMQLPFLRVPSCGMVVADEQFAAASGAQPYQVMPRGGMPGQVLMAPRQTLSAIARAANKQHESYADALLHAATSLGLATWAVPGIRIDATKPVAQGAGQEPPDARSAG